MMLGFTTKSKGRCIHFSTHAAVHEVWGGGIFSMNPQTLNQTSSRHTGGKKGFFGGPGLKGYGFGV